MSLKALVVDDEEPARQELRYRLGVFPDIEVVGEAATAREALQLCSAVSYDVLFLDIQMPGVDGIELAEEIRKTAKGSPNIVFVTAFDEYAVKAFQVRALDYLLKPFEDARLEETIFRLLGKDPGKREAKRTQNFLEWVPTEKNGTTIPIPVTDIIYFMTERDYVYVQTFNEKLITRFTMQELTERLPSKLFFRCHRSFMVNVHQIKEIIPYINGAYILKMKDKVHSEVTVSRGRVKHLKELFALQ